MTQQSELAPVVAPMGLRIAAFLIDLVLWSLVSIILSKFWNDDLDVLSTMLFYCYSVLLHWLYGATIGKMLLGLKVIGFPSGMAIGFVTSVVRDIVYAFLFVVATLVPFATTVDLEALDWLMPVFFVCDTAVAFLHKSNRSLHDLLASTVVVRIPR